MANLTSLLHPSTGDDGGPIMLTTQDSKTAIGFSNDAVDINGNEGADDKSDVHTGSNSTLAAAGGV